jgi:hypothetical protein
MNRNIACDALTLNKRLQLNYKGHVRTLEVHSVGVATKGHPAILAFQVEGGSNSTEQQGWKFLNLDEATSVTILDEASEAPRNGYRGGVRGMIEIFAQVPLPHDSNAEAVTSH